MTAQPVTRVYAHPVSTPAVTPEQAIAYHALQARYSATVTTREALRRRILRRARQQRLTAAWGLRTATGTRSAS